MSAAQDEQQRLWSVTTLIKAGLPKEALVYWTAKVTAERAYDDLSILESYAAKQRREEAIKYLTDARWQTAGKAAARGTALHQAAEQYALGQTPQVEEHVVPWVKQYVQFLHDHAPEFIASEAPVYNLTERYAGTMDGIVRIQGKLLLLDVKTHAKDVDAKSRPPYPDVALQLVAYARAERIGIDPAQQRNYSGRRYYIWTDQAAWTPMPVLDGALCLAIAPDYYELVPVAIDDEVWEAFLSVRAVARWALQTSQRVLGPVLTPAPAQGSHLDPAPQQGSTDGRSFIGEEPPPPPDTRTAGEREMEEFMTEANQADATDEYEERIRRFLSGDNTPRTSSELSKLTHSSQAKCKAAVDRMARNGQLINRGTDGRPRYSLKGDDE